jgi:glycosyltransferase involved in cell wall biosynthesis
MALAPHAAGLAMREEILGVRVHRYRYGRDAAETLAYAGTMADQVLRSWSARLRLVRLLVAARRALRVAVADFRPDVIHVHWWFPGGLAVWPVPPRGVPIVLTSHGTDLFLLDRAAIARPVARRVFGCAREVTVISTPLAVRVRALGVPAERITVVPMPVEPDAAEHAAPLENDSRDAGLIVFVGRLVERKGAEFAIRALAILRRTRADLSARLIVAGDGPERDALRRLASDLAVSDAVEMTGTLSRDGVTALYRRASAFVLPAVTDWKGEQEGFGMVIVEAMLHALPVVASRSGGIPDIVRDGENGLLVAERDPEAIARALERVLSDPAMARRLGDAAQADVRDRFAPRRIAEIFDTVYSRAAGRA